MTKDCATPTQPSRPRKLPAFAFSPTLPPLLLPPLLLLLLLLLLLGFTSAAGASANDPVAKAFKLDLDETEEESGERVQLHSQGTLAQSVELDVIPQVKRVACVGSQLLLAMTDSSVAHGWRRGQLVIGGPKWGCNATWAVNGSLSASAGVRIYVKIDKVVFAVEGRPEVSPVDMVTIHHVTAGPLDMLKEANIFFRYQPPSSASPSASRSERSVHKDSQSRFRRSLYNLVSNLVGDVNWHATFNSTLPFNVGNDSSGNPAETITLHKSWGQQNLSVARGKTEANNVNNDFVLVLDRLRGENRLTYTFDLVVKYVNGSPQILRYISQFDVNSNLSTDATAKFHTELGLTYPSTAVWSSPSTEIVRIPVARPAGLPPIYLVVSAESVVQASVQAYSSGANALRTAFRASGFVTLSQQYDPLRVRNSDVTTRDWTVVTQDQNLATDLTTQADFSIFQTLKLKSSISWHYHDVDLDLSPPVEITLKPVLTLKSSNQGVARCTDSSLSLDALVSAQESRLTVQAFGFSIWNVTLQPAMSRSLHLLDMSLGHQCRVRCHGPSQLSNVMSRVASDPLVRGNQAFSSLRALSGSLIAFVDKGTSQTWCGSSGTPCPTCSAHAYNTPTSRTCATRLMTSRLASAVSRLAEMVAAEWPDRQLLVLEAWDEASSAFPSGAYPITSVFKEGRGAAVALTSPATSPTPMTVTPADLDRLGQLAVCSGLERVQGRSAGQGGGLEVAVEREGYHVTRAQLGDEEADTREEFWNLLENTNVDAVFSKCASAPRVAPGSSWPDVLGGPESVVGPTDTPLARSSRESMDSLVPYSQDGTSVTFAPEGKLDSWCGVPTRQCSDCVTSSAGLESWSWCSTRLMTPRLALRFRTLQKLAEKSGFGIRVTRGFSEPSADSNTSSPIFNEGRALILTTNPRGNEARLASLAVCAGFDFVQHSAAGQVTVYVQSQHGYRAHSVEYLEGSSHLAVPLRSLENARDFDIPTAQLAMESDLPLLVDGGFRPDVMLSQHVRLGDILSDDSRYFRFDGLLLTCVELAMMDYGGKLAVRKNSAFRTRAANFLSNMDAGHVQEQWRHMTGQALRLFPSNPDANSLFALAKSILRECPALAQRSQKGVGLGCHADHLYLDIRPLEKGKELEYVTVWNSGTGYCKQVAFLQLSLLAGGPVVQSLSSVTCRDRGLDPGLEFISFQRRQQGFCQTTGQAEFCQVSHQAREKAADDLQGLLTAAAGHGRLPRFAILPDIRACLVDTCGGCPGAGPTFDAKVLACSRVVHKYLERAAAPFPELHNVTTFFNTDTEGSTVQGEACRAGRVCVEETVMYSLLIPTVTRRFFPNPARSVERELFSSAVNPTPLLDLAAQELAARTSGIVAVYIQSDGDIYALRNVLKVLFTYNQRVTLVEIHVAPGVDADLVTSSIQRKLTSWAGVTCPKHSRFAVSPFTVIRMDAARARRSVARSSGRNKVKAAMYNWELQWLASFT